MAAPEKEIKERIKLLYQEAELQNQIYQQDNRRTTALKESKKAQEEILRLEAQLTDTYKETNKSLDMAIKAEKKLAVSGKDRFGFQKHLLKSVQDQAKSTKALLQDNKISKDLAKKTNEINDDIVQQNYTLENLAVVRRDISDELRKAIESGNEDLAEHLQGTLKVLSAERKRLQVQGLMKKGMETANSITGGMGDTIKNAIMNPLTASIAILMAFTAQQEAIANEFGALGVTEFRDDLAGASQEFTKMGLEGKDALSTTKQLSAEFGIGFQKAAEMSQEVGDLSKSTGLALEDSTKLMGIFTETQGMTSGMAMDLLKSTEALAAANGVAPNVVLKDVANNTEMFAKFAKDGGENVLRAAIQARKLGISLDKVGSAAEGLLDFQSSLNAEVEASIMMGRQVNLQKAREAALAGDLEGVQKEILKQVGSAAEFNKMNVLQRRSLAKAMGMELGDLQKLVNKQEEQVSLAGELEKATTKNMVPKETLTNVAELLANLKALGMELAESLGPAVEGIVGAFTGFVSILNDANLLVPLLAFYMSFLTAKTILQTYATIQKEMADRRAAKASLAKAAAEGAEAAAETASAIPVIGWAIAIAGLVALGVAIAGFMGAFETGTPLAGVKQDGVAALHKGETILNKKDTEMLEKQQAAVKNGATRSTNVTNVDTSGLERQNKELKGEMSQLRKDMASYFGTGGTAAKQMGKRVGSKFESLRG
tara:strand:+ start:276 stop:2414 length:2139 start_codon:yes stop_codon:yes gene_type:complete